jgi:hypothetical protein
MTKLRSVTKRLWRWVRACGGRIAAAVVLAAGLDASAWAQDTAFSGAQVDQTFAPVALYPDALLAQVLMAAPYPADVNEAAAWSRTHTGVKGDEAVKQVQANAWEPAVQSLVAFPQVLATMPPPTTTATACSSMRGG